MHDASPRTRPRWLTGITLLGVLATAGCVFPAPTPVSPLTTAQVMKVEACQKAVTVGGRKFVNTKLSKLETCVQEVLKWRLRFENGLITAAEFDARIEEVRAKCRRLYGQITKASTTFVDGIIDKCGPAAEFVLGPYDALRFQALATQTSLMVPSTAEELGGLFCGAKELLVDASLTAQIPRALELLNYLGSEFVTIDMDTGIPNVVLDPRCIPVTP